jgi:hypothetical protein
MSYVRRFFAFWYDFLVGDKLELFVGPILALAVVAGAIRLGLDTTLAGLLLFASVAAVAGFSLVRSVGIKWLRR